MLISTKKYTTMFFAFSLWCTHALPTSQSAESKNHWLIDKVLDLLGIGNETPQDPYAPMPNDDEIAAIRAARKNAQEALLAQEQMKNLAQSIGFLLEHQTFFEQLKKVAIPGSVDFHLAALALYTIHQGLHDTSATKKLACRSLALLQDILYQLRNPNICKEAWALIQTDTYLRHKTLGIPHLNMRLKVSPVAGKIISEASTVMNLSEKTRKQLVPDEAKKAPIYDFIQYIAAATRTMLEPQDHLRAFVLLNACFALLDMAQAQPAHYENISLLQEVSIATQINSQETSLPHKFTPAASRLIEAHHLIYCENMPIPEVSEWLASLCKSTHSTLSRNYTEAHLETLKHLQTFIINLLTPPADIKSLFFAQTPLIPLIQTTYATLTNP